MADTTGAKPRFDPSRHTTPISTADGKRDFLPAKWSNVWFREQCPDGFIETSIAHFEPDVFVLVQCRASKGRQTTADGVIVEGGVSTAYGHGRFRVYNRKQNKEIDVPDFVERAETKAIGRALRSLGFGIEFGEEDEEDAGTDAASNGGSDRRSSVKSVAAPTEKIGADPAKWTGPAAWGRNEIDQAYEAPNPGKAFREVKEKLRVRATHQEVWDYFDQMVGSAGCEAIPHGAD